MENDAQPIRYKRWEDVPERLLSKSALREKGLKPGLDVRGMVYMKSRHIWVELFDEKEAIPRKPATPKQLAALEKAKAAQIEARTCRSCGQIHTKALSGKLCDFCTKELWLEQESLRAYERFCIWVDRAAEYAVLDVETNGLDDAAEIVEIAIVGLDEKVLYHSLIKPQRSISIESTFVHGITDYVVAGAPHWDEVWPEVRSVLAKRTTLIFNEGFDARMVYSACRRYGFPVERIESECVMETYARYVQSYNHYHRNFTWISLRDALLFENVSGSIPHRATGDGILTVRLINTIAKKHSTT